MKRVFYIVFYVVLLTHVTFYSLKAVNPICIEIDEQKSLPFFSHTKAYEEKMKDTVELISNLHQSKAQDKDLAKLEALACDGEPLALKYFWDFKVGPNPLDEALFVKYYLEKDISLYALGNLGGIVITHANDCADFSKELDTIINTSKSAKSLRAKLNLAIGLGYLGKGETIPERHKHLRKVAEHLKDFTESSEAETCIAQHLSFIRGGYIYLFSQAYIYKFQQLFVDYLNEFTKGPKDSSALEGIQALYSVLKRSAPIYIDTIQKAYNIRFLDVKSTPQNETSNDKVSIS